MRWEMRPRCRDEMENTPCGVPVVVYGTIKHAIMQGTVGIFSQKQET